MDGDVARRGGAFTYTARAQKSALLMSTPSTALRDPGPWKPLKDERRTIRELKALELLALLDVSYRDGLVKLRTIAVRKGLWFKALSAVERAVVDLTIRVVERVRSSALKRALESIASKVVGALKLRSFRERALAVGRALAERVARAAERLGCERAKDWARGPCFAMYLGVSWPNTSPVFRCPL